ncbi:polymer-forming cytoskeletal family protein [Helicobacter valdiviensis]|uniref:Polymer-forming cytoskeletal family protein n=1 Tax=Helicobacter valdiviensis TaxID=1458358 RepID=A0A2W6NKS1_9HELI|nr:polymer-forming cytoskeletal protein [Helicobacter valdiviensis]PZT48006.1 polymer-forming cytoskeletal family protein [Helicobacter valdiviensis]
MAIFTNNDKQASGNSGNTSIISQGTKIKGDIISECSLHIDGAFEGNIIAKNSVTIGKNGSVKGSINAEHLMVSGKLMGNCDCNMVEILPQGRIDGEVAAREIVIEKTAEFVGQSIVHKDRQHQDAFSNKDKKPLGVSTPSTEAKNS